MNLAYLLLFWVAFTVLFATMQGLLLPTLRRTGNAAMAKVHDCALHRVGLAAYLLPVALSPSWLALAIALTVRFTLFDAFVNYAAGDPIFHVGRTAKTDKALQFLAAKTGVSASVLSAGLRLLAFLLLVVLVYFQAGR